MLNRQNSTAFFVSGLPDVIDAYLLFYHSVFIVGINDSDQMAIYQILAAILHLSNVEVKDQSADRSSIMVNTDYFWTQQASCLYCLFVLLYYVEDVYYKIIIVDVFLARWRPPPGILWVDGGALWRNGPLVMSQKA